jgi:hypothetical protein
MMKRKLLRGLLTAVLLILMLVGVSAAATPPENWGSLVDPNLIQPPAPEAWARHVSELLASGELFPSLASTNPLTPNCRVGVNAWGDQLRDFDLVSNFGVGTYFNYGASTPQISQLKGAEHIGLVMVYQLRPDDPAENIDKLLSCDGTYTDYEIRPALTDGPGGLGRILEQNPGKLWFLGNEPDRRATDDSDVCPQQYADAYHDFYHFVKGRDPTAQVGVAGLVQVSPGRLQYRDIVWDTYLARYGSPMPVDVWNMHIYLLSETSHGDAHIAVGTDPKLRIPASNVCGIPGTFCSANHDNVEHFAQQVISMRRWMNERGQRNKPLVLSEFGINLPYHYDGICTDLVCPANPPDTYGCYCDTYGRTLHPERVAEYLRKTMAYLMNTKHASLGYPADENRLVQQWLWFSAETAGPGNASNLVVSTGSSYALSPQGRAFRDYVTSIPLHVNLLPTVAWAPSRSSLDGMSPVTATLKAEIRNNGNRALNKPVVVSFYANAAQTDLIGTASVQGLGGCARTSVTVQVEWPNRVTGAHRFWVVVDDSQIPGSNPHDNVLQGVFIANPIQVYLPLAARR